jgi:hypothetical protein
MKAALVTCVLIGCGGVVAAETDGGGADAADASTLAACAHACVVQAQGDCPALLLYECLQPVCGGNASTAICEEGNGMPAPLATIECVRSAFPTCQANACQNDATCKTFIACIEACH